MSGMLTFGMAPLQEDRGQEERRPVSSQQKHRGQEERRQVRAFGDRWQVKHVVFTWESMGITQRSMRWQRPALTPHSHLGYALALPSISPLYLYPTQEPSCEVCGVDSDVMLRLRPPGSESHWRLGYTHALEVEPPHQCLLPVHDAFLTQHPLPIIQGWDFSCFNRMSCLSDYANFTLLQIHANPSSLLTCSPVERKS